MNKNVSLLDCTLRDGGYNNDWDFGNSVIKEIFIGLQNSGVEMIEVGFLDDRRVYDFNRTILPNTNSINKTFKNMAKKSMVVAMIDYGTCSLENISNCEDSFIDGIRVIFKKDKIDNALPFCKALKDKGYKLFIQAISITSYSDNEMLDYIKKINVIKPYAFSIVDTYGLMHIENVQKYFQLIDNNLEKEIKIGYHAHNNFQLAYSNSISLLKFETNREIIIDSTIYGMGKGAGNCNTELIMMYLNENFGKQYDIDQVLEIIDTNLMTLHKQYNWGYKYNHYISALNKCHPEYVSFLLDKKSLSVKDVNSILQMIPDETKLFFKKDYAQEIYVRFQSKYFDDSRNYLTLRKILEDKKILLLGPGESLNLEKSVINTYIKENNPVVISTNFIPTDFKIDYAFFSNTKRYIKLKELDEIKDLREKLIITSNIIENDIKIDFQFSYESLIEIDNIIIDNSLLLLINALIKLDIKEISLAGFDGYNEKNMNYYKRDFSFDFTSDQILNNNATIAKYLNKNKKNLTLNFVTKSLYEIE